MPWRRQVSVVAITAYCFLLAISSILLGAPGARRGIYSLMTLAAIIVVVVGRRFVRVAAIVASVLSIGMILQDGRRGRALQQQVDALRAKYTSTSSPSTSRSNGDIKESRKKDIAD